MPRAAQPIADRFWEKVACWGATADECWEWDAARTPAGYGKLGRVSAPGWTWAHRVSWTLANGPIPKDMYVLHRCDNPPCVNPKHLWLGTLHDNTLDMIAKGRTNNPFKTHCKRGHLFDEENTYIYRDGRRGCRACTRLHHLRYQEAGQAV